MTKSKAASSIKSVFADSWVSRLGYLKKSHRHAQLTEASVSAPGDTISILHMAIKGIGCFDAASMKAFLEEASKPSCARLMENLSKLLTNAEQYSQTMTDLIELRETTKFSPQALRRYGSDFHTLCTGFLDCVEESRNQLKPLVNTTDPTMVELEAQLQEFTDFGATFKGWEEEGSGGVGSSQEANDDMLTATIPMGKLDPVIEEEQPK